MFFYSIPEDEPKPNTQPDAEVFYLQSPEKGWYFWFCRPGCLPDDDPYGPFETMGDAIHACREMVNE